MMAILDLDYTLLDTARFKFALAGIFASCGVASDEFKRTYDMTVTARFPEYDYDIGRHIDLLSGVMTCGSEDLESRVDALLRSIHECLYPGAREFLRDLRKSGMSMVLLTLGNETWQRRKIEHSGLVGLFDDIVTVAAGKECVLGEISDGHDTVFIINDNVDEVMKMRETYPHFSYIVKRGPKGVPDGFGLPVCDTYGEIFSLVTSDL